MPEKGKIPDMNNAGPGQEEGPEQKKNGSEKEEKPEKEEKKDKRDNLVRLLPLSNPDADASTKIDFHYASLFPDSIVREVLAPPPEHA